MEDGEKTVKDARKQKHNTNCSNIVTVKNWKNKTDKITESDSSNRILIN